MSMEVEPLDRKEILATLKMLAGGQELIALLHSQEDCTSRFRADARYLEMMSGFVSVP